MLPIIQYDSSEKCEYYQCVYVYRNQEAYVRNTSGTKYVFHFYL
jgi:hypothetical protein